jgi:hypothetical protein
MMVAGEALPLQAMESVKAKNNVPCISNTDIGFILFLRESHSLLRGISTLLQSYFCLIAITSPTPGTCNFA